MRIMRIGDLDLCHVSSLQYWPYSWLSPHSLILLASCWAFFFSRQALETEGKKKKAPSLSGTRKPPCRCFPVLHATPLPHLPSLTLGAAGRRWVEDVFLKRAEDWLETSLIPPLLQQPLDTTTLKGYGRFGFRVFWVEKWQRRMNQSIHVKY